MLRKMRKNRNKRFFKMNKFMKIRPFAKYVNKQSGHYIVDGTTGKEVRPTVGA